MTPAPTTETKHTPGVTVKQLDWKAYPEDGSVLTVEGDYSAFYKARAITEIGSYFLAISGEEWQWRHSAKHHFKGGFSSQAAAQTDAQADFERRVLSCLNNAVQS